MPYNGWPPLRNTKSEPEEIEIRLEGAFCGNPWKLFRKSYRDGIEIKVINNFYIRMNKKNNKSKI